MQEPKKRLGMYVVGFSKLSRSCLDFISIRCSIVSDNLKILNLNTYGFECFVRAREIFFGPSSRTDRAVLYEDQIECLAKSKSKT